MITSPLLSISITSVLASSWDGDYLAGGARAGVDPAAVDRAIFLMKRKLKCQSTNCRHIDWPIRII